MTKLTNVAEAADFIHAKVKNIKKSQAKDKCCSAKTDLNSHVYAVRNGEPEVLIVCDDDAIKQAFNIAARIFNGEMVAVAIDGRCIEGERRHMLTIAVDRMGGLGFVQQFYDVTPEGLSLDKPITVGKPSFLKKRIQKDMHAAMADPVLELPEFIVAGLKKFDSFDMSPEATQAFIDQAAAVMVQEFDYIGVNQVALIANPDSPRGKALVRPGLPIFK